MEPKEPTKVQASVELWSINRWLRYTGFRLFVEMPHALDEPTRIGIRWWGFKD